MGSSYYRLLLVSCLSGSVVLMAVLALLYFGIDTGDNLRATVLAVPPNRTSEPGVGACYRNNARRLCVEVSPRECEDLATTRNGRSAFVSIVHANCVPGAQYLQMTDFVRVFPNGSTAVSPAPKCRQKLRERIQRQCRRSGKRFQFIAGPLEVMDGQGRMSDDPGSSTCAAVFKCR